MIALFYIVTVQQFVFIDPVLDSCRLGLTTKFFSLEHSNTSLALHIDEIEHVVN